MSDLFHEDVREEFIRRAFEVMTQANWHVFQVLTKRAKRLAEVAPRPPWPSNVWPGVSVENARYTSRVVDLVKVPAAVEWVRAIRDQCAQAGVAFFFKQWGGRTPKSGGRSLDGQEWNEMSNSRQPSGDGERDRDVVRHRGFALAQQPR